MEDVLARETKLSGRSKQTQGLFSSLQKFGHLESDIPVIIAGDWNSPSHLDYTAATKHLHKGLVVPVPTSVKFEKEGFFDA